MKIPFVIVILLFMAALSTADPRMGKNAAARRKAISRRYQAAVKKKNAQTLANVADPTNLSKAECKAIGSNGGLRGKKTAAQKANMARKKAGNCKRHTRVPILSDFAEAVNDVGSDCFIR
ncbi:MAG: hypothetical protein SGCHY_005114, partial [Lobulomycetales sp.]